MDLEPAIPETLRQERTLPVKTPPDYLPPFPAYSARFPTSIKTLVMAIIGAQHQTPPQTSSLIKPLTFITSASSTPPAHHDLASVTDNQGHYNETIIAYWADHPSYTTWRRTSGFDAWWTSLDPDAEPHGWFLEVFLPPLARVETVFSDAVVPEGMAHLRDGVSGPIREHVYWGSMRDRLPAAQRDELRGGGGGGGGEGGQEGKDGRKRRVKIPGQRNLAVIRSGQDWSNTTPHERKLYLDTMHPVLIRGMDFLRDEGKEVGCFSCRFMDVLGHGSPSSDLKDGKREIKGGTEKTFGLAYFNELASLEGWSRDHQTHLDIFGRFLNYAKELQNQVSLRLFHEVLVLSEEQQEFEYVGCHAGTGMMAAVSA